MPRAKTSCDGLHGSLVRQGEATTLIVDYASWKGRNDHNALEIAVTMSRI
jgi:hypothetical protein